MSIPISTLMERLSLSEDGHLRWKVHRKRTYIGKIAGCIDCYGYRVVKLCGKISKAHRVVWAIAHGEWPAQGMEIDHIDGNKDNNRIENLRLATTAENLRARRFTKNKTGHRCVCYISGRYSVVVQSHGKAIFCGSFKSLEEAVEVSHRARKQHHGEFYTP